MVSTSPATRLTYEDYAKTSDDERWELIHGELFVPPSPIESHQVAGMRLGIRMGLFVEEKGLGQVFSAPYDVVLSDTDVVQPDLLFVSKDRADIITADNVQGAPDMVVEVLSPTTAKRDWRVKLDLYSKHGVREFWLVDPQTEIVWVLLPKEGSLGIAAIYSEGDTLTSPTLEGLTLDMGEIFPK